MSEAFAQNHAPTSHKPPRSNNFLKLHLLANQWPALHGLRVLGIVCVLQWHVTSGMVEEGMMANGMPSRFSTNLFFGMDLFFVLSGFLIGTMILHALDATKRQSLGRFYLRRSFRIFPLYYVVLTYLALYHATPAARSGVIWEYLYLTNYRPLEPRQLVVMNYGWSLCVEEHFYILAPLLVGALNVFRTHRARLLILGLLWLTPLVLRLILIWHREWLDGARYVSIAYVRTHFRFDTLVAGVIAAYVNFHFKDRIKQLMSAKGRVYRAALYLSVGCLLALLATTPLSSGVDLLAAFAIGTVTSLMFLPLLLLLLHADTPFGRFLSRRGFLPIATLGYGIYLVHIPVLDVFLLPACRRAIAVGVPLAVVWVVCLALLVAISAGIAYALHILVEKPALYLRDKVAPA
ncbi:MAG TPA: acyltransferase [Polyangia bacterium]